MDKINLERLYMLKQLVEFNDETAQDTVSYPAYEENAQELKTLIAEYSGVSEKLITKITGTASDKQIVRNHLIDAVIGVSMGLKPMAKKVNNMALYDQVSFARSYLARLRDETLLSLSGEIRNLGSEHLAELAVYNITQETLDHLLAASNNFSAILVKPRAKINNRKDNLRVMYSRISQAMKVVREQLDAIAQLVNLQNQNWYDRYKDARLIVNLGPIHTKVKGLVLDAQMQGLFNAHVKVRSNDMLLETQTDFYGRFDVKGLKPGVYHVEISKNGYKSFESPNFLVKLGKEFMVNTKLESESSELKKVA